jgi:DsbC/DsbD-like thiol-disulfide interchange protein
VHLSAATLVAFAFALISAAPPASPKYIEVKLVAESAAPAPGGTILVGLQMTPRPGWHGYWSNPGENGLAPVVQWATPEGVRFGPLEHPAPTLLQASGVTSFVHTGPHTLISRMKVASTVAPGTPLPITADVTFAACSDNLCVPEHATLKLQLVAGDGRSSADGLLLRRAANQIPRRIDDGTFDIAGGKLLLQLPASAGLRTAQARFFPDVNGYFNAARAGTFEGEPGRISAPLAGPAPSRIVGVISDGSTAYRLTFRRGPVLAAAKTPLPNKEDMVGEKAAGIPSDGKKAVSAAPATPERQRGPAGGHTSEALVGGLMTALMLAGAWVFGRSRR